MKRGFLLPIVLLLLISLPIHSGAGSGRVSDAVDGGVEPEPFPSGDIWIHGGAYCVWDSGASVFEDETDIVLLRDRFLQESPFSVSARPVNSKNPISAAARDIYILDNTPLYLGEVSAGNIYGIGEINVMGGVLRTDTIRAASDVFIGSGSEVYIEGALSSGGFIESYGSIVEAGSIDARGIWLDSSDGSLYAAVSGDILTGYYTQQGGSVTIGGGLYAMIDGGDLHSGITVSGEYAYNNPTALSVGGDLVSAGSGGGIAIGGGSGFGGLDEAAFKSFEVLRSAKKNRGISVYGVAAGNTEQSCNVLTGGNLRASGEIVVYSGHVHVMGIIECPAAVSVLGGTVLEGVFPPC